MLIDDINNRKFVFDTEFVVIDIVCRGHFKTSCTEVHSHIAVLDDRNLLIDKGNKHLLTFQIVVSLILRVDTYSSIRHDGLWTCSSDNYVFIRRFTILRDEISEIVELRLGLFTDYLLITHCGKRLWIPVHHPHTTIDVTFFVEIYESIDNRLAEWLIHSKFGSVPITRCTELLELLENNTTMLLFPLPSVFEELFTGK